MASSAEIPADDPRALLETAGAAAGTRVLCFVPHHQEWLDVLGESGCEVVSASPDLFQPTPDGKSFEIVVAELPASGKGLPEPVRSVLDDSSVSNARLILVDASDDAEEVEELPKSVVEQFIKSTPGGFSLTRVGRPISAWWAAIFDRA
jgi:hypothetical protein